MEQQFCARIASRTTAYSRCNSSSVMAKQDAADGGPAPDVQHGGGGGEPGGNRRYNDSS